MAELSKPQAAVLSISNKVIVGIHRTSNGKMFGTIQGAPLGLLTTTGRRTKESRTRPVCYGKDEALDHLGRLIVMGTAGGSPQTPSWVYNLRADPKARFEIGKETIDVLGVEITGAERDRMWAWMAEKYPVFQKYPKKTDRIFPIFALEPAT